MAEYAYKIWMPNAKKSNNYSERIIYARFLLLASLEIFKNTNFNTGSYDGVKFSADITKPLYKTASFRNWGYGYLKGYLKTIHDVLQSSNTLSYDEVPFEDEKGLNVLKGRLFSFLNTLLHYDSRIQNWIRQQKNPKKRKMNQQHRILNFLQNIFLPLHSMN